MFRQGQDLLQDRAATIDSRMVAGARMLLAFAALVIIVFDPTEPDRFVPATYSALIAYSLFSLIVFVLVTNQKVLIHPALNNPYWLDVAWYLLFITLSSGTSSIFFFFFYFAILNASFLRGFRSGLKVTIVSAVGFSVLGYLSASSVGNFELARFILRPLSLLTLGYMMSYWGGYQARSLRRLQLLRDMSTLSNPRFGVDRTIGVNMELLRRFFDADTCLLVTADGEGRNAEFRKVERGNDGMTTPTEPLDPRLAEPMLAIPKAQAAIFDAWRPLSLFRRDTLWAFDREKEAYVRTEQAPYLALAERLDVASYITAPIVYRDGTAGRIFIFLGRSGKLEQSDIEFLLQAIAQFVPIVENIRLVDRLASGAAEEERKKIARDIHDSIIQPYIGLQMGVDSLAQLLDEERDAGTPATTDQLRTRIARLRELTESGVEDLRDYVHGLADSPERGPNLPPAIRRYSEKFSSATGIKVDVASADNINIADRLAAELFQIVAEGLSNIRRHTRSPEAAVGIRLSGDSIVLNISNIDDEPGPDDFTPRSISERAESLGGTVRVRKSDHKTEVVVRIPL